eukprot:CAMPEP_0116885318 /NCGR_PEP_ID=MMETSP0463-20121206/18608_1 /TAXON_ID=181622 /ORGANISM="Strombidinopsis sp, Strain SopsisLIS2011" /LENGTH=36 /DNA_ID= /DNA_START= /DNA_END= /DNA_ORIENTATION=
MKMFNRKVLVEKFNLEKRDISQLNNMVPVDDDGNPV